MVADLLFPIIGFAIGLSIIVKASDIAVDLSVEFSKITGMSKLSIGMLILATMTSLPELAISLSSTFAGSSNIMVGTLLGSNVTNILLLIGLGALFFELKINNKDFQKSWQIMLATTLLITYGFFYGYDIVFGFLCVISFIFFSEGIIFNKSKSRAGYPKDRSSGLKSLLKIFAVVIVIVLSAFLVVLSTQQLSVAAGISGTFLGATIIAITTSLPELAVTISSGRKGQFDIMFGNIFGSCFVNIALVMGISTIISGVSFTTSDITIMISMFVTYTISYFFMKGGNISRTKGIILLFLYVSYLITMASIA